MPRRRKGEQLRLFPTAGYTPPTLAGLEAEAVKAAEKAQQLFADGFEHQAVRSAYNSIILFAALDELRRRRNKDADATGSVRPRYRGFAPLP